MPMDSAEDLQRRRAACTAADAVPGMFFNSTLEWVLREAGADAAASVQTTRAFPRRVIPFLRYPARDYLDVVEGAANAVVAAKGLSFNDALVKIGMTMISVFMHGPVGKTMRTMLGGQPHRMMGGATSAYTVTFSFGEREYQRRTATEGALVCRRELLGPAITEGVLKCGLELTCPVQVTTAIEDQQSPSDFTVVVRW